MLRLVVYGDEKDSLMSAEPGSVFVTRPESGRAEIFFDQTNSISGSYSRGYASSEGRKTGEKRVA
jgi:hypothetical protein